MPNYKIVKREDRAGNRVYSGHRIETEIWAQFVVLARSQELSANAALNRLVRHAISKEWIPEFIKNPHLPYSTPVREVEPPVNQIVDEQNTIPKTHQIDE